MLVSVFALVLASCENYTIPIVVHNDYFETLDEVIVGGGYTTNILPGKSKEVQSRTNTVIVDIYTASNNRIQSLLNLYPHHAYGTLTITKKGRILYGR